MVRVANVVYLGYTPLEAPSQVCGVEETCYALLHNVPLTGYTRDMMQETATIFGKHSVTEALLARPDVVREIFVTADMDDDVLHALIKKLHVPFKVLDHKKLISGIPKEAVHQGVVAVVDVGALVTPYATFIKNLTVTHDTALVILGEVHDPHNVGAVIRSAAAFGISGVIIPEHRQAQVNSTIIKVSAGMAFRVPLVSVGNVNLTVRDLKERGFWIYGLDENAETTLQEEAFEKPSVFILGNEATGIRQKTLELCDIPLRIPMHMHTESLNASVAAGVTLYAWSLCHPTALRISR